MGQIHFSNNDPIITDWLKFHNTSTLRPDILEYLDKAENVYHSNYFDSQSLYEQICKIEVSEHDLNQKEKTLLDWSKQKVYIQYKICEIQELLKESSPEVTNNLIQTLKTHQFLSEENKDYLFDIATRHTIRKEIQEILDDLVIIQSNDYDVALNVIDFWLQKKLNNPEKESLLKAKSVLIEKILNKNKEIRIEISILLDNLKNVQSNEYYTVLTNINYWLQKQLNPLEKQLLCLAKYQLLERIDSIDDLLISLGKNTIRDEESSISSQELIHKKKHSHSDPQIYDTYQKSYYNYSSRGSNIDLIINEIADCWSLYELEELQIKLINIENAHLDEQSLNNYNLALSMCNEKMLSLVQT